MNKFIFLFVYNEFKMAQLCNKKVGNVDGQENNGLTLSFSSSEEDNTAMLSKHCLLPSLYISYAISDIIINYVQ